MQPQSLTSSSLLDLQDTLPQVLALEHTQKSVDRIVHSIRDMIIGLETAIRNPLGDILIPRLMVLHDVRIIHQETLPLQSPDHHAHRVLDAVCVLRTLVVVLRDGATRHYSTVKKMVLLPVGRKGLTNPPKHFHIQQRRIQHLPTHVIVENIQPLWSILLDRTRNAFLLIVESRLHAKFFL